MHKSSVWFSRRPPSWTLHVARCPSTTGRTGWGTRLHVYRLEQVLREEATKIAGVEDTLHARERLSAWEEAAKIPGMVSTERLIVLSCSAERLLASAEQVLAQDLGAGPCRAPWSSFLKNVPRAASFARGPGSRCATQSLVAEPVLERKLEPASAANHATALGSPNVASGPQPRKPQMVVNLSY